jgi:hypothetical protein
VNQNSITSPGFLKDFMHYLHPGFSVNTSSQLVTDSRLYGVPKYEGQYVSI